MDFELKVDLEFRQYAQTGWKRVQERLA